MGRMNGQNGHGDPPFSEDERVENVVRIPTLAERDRIRKEKEKAEKRAHRLREPMINLPPLTKWSLAVLFAIFLLSHIILSPQQSDALILTFGFIPANFGGAESSFLLYLTPFTHMLLHGGWMHILLNGFMLTAFGSGIERWLGARRLFILFVISGLCGAAMHYVLNTNSPFPMIGASGGLSGLFAAAIIMINRGQREMGGRFGILPFALLWIGISIGFGMMGGPDGSSIAWAAHVGGFLGGFAALKIVRA